MTKRGFTLVEMLIVFAVLGVIFAIVYPITDDVIRQGKKTVNDVQINKILNSTYDYSLKNIKILPDYDETIFVTLNELKKEGYIESSLINTTTREEYSNDLVISIKNVGNNYNTKKNYSKLKGKYLYTVETDFMNSYDFKKNKPTISLEGYDSLVSTININSSFTEPKYSAQSFDNKDLTNKVIKNIIYNSSNTDKVDTSKAGIYYINYTVVDEYGYSNGIVLNVIITDKEAPELTIPENITISIDDENYDLEKGASCIDNSGVCDIEIKGYIKYGVADKYIIEYIAKDPSGNTTTLKRVITVK